MTLATDPVCGMTVDVDNPPAHSQYRDRHYYFCAQACKDAFDQDPERYAFAYPGIKNACDEQAD